MSDKDSHKNLIPINSICSCIDFSGLNCTDFLNNLLISDLSSLEHDKFHYTALCNPKGRIISSLWIRIQNEKQVQLVGPINMQDELLNFFNMRKFRLKINLEVSDVQILIDKNGKIITCPQDQNIQTVDVNDSVFYSIMFNVNFPWINKENTEKFIPQHVNLDQHDQVMSFKKGCYPGQEIIARLKFLGNINKRMRVLESDSEEKLLENLKSQNQVSPIIHLNNTYLVQAIEKVSSEND